MLYGGQKIIWEIAHQKEHKALLCSELPSNNLHLINKEDSQNAEIFNLAFSYFTTTVFGLKV